MHCHPFVFNQAMPATPEPTTYPLAPTVVARFMGLGLVLVAVLVFVGTLLVALLDLPADLMVALLVVAVLGIVVLAWWLRSRAWVLSCDDTGYAVRLVRGAGVTQARWTDVEDAATTTRHCAASAGAGTPSPGASRSPAATRSWRAPRTPPVASSR